MNKVLAVVVLQFVLVGALLGVRGFTVWTGEAVILETAPVDPRDLFRGDYATLNYEISDLTVAGTYQDGQRIWVLLEQEGAYHDAVSVHTGVPDVGPGQSCIRGRIAWADTRSDEGHTRIHIEYGIESFFIPEGAGDPPRDAKVDAVVHVDRFCTGVVTGLLVDGEPWEPRRGGTG